MVVMMFWMVAKWLSLCFGWLLSGYRDVLDGCQVVVMMFWMVAKWLS